MRKYLSRQYLKNSLKWGRKQPPKSIKPKSPKQTKHKTPVNQNNEDQTQRATIKSMKGKGKNNTQGDSQNENS